MRKAWMSGLLCMGLACGDGDENGGAGLDAGDPVVATDAGDPGMNPDAGEDPTDDACPATVLAADFQADVPLAGPGVDPATGALIPPAEGSYLVATTFLRLQRTEAAMTRFGELSAPIVEDLQTRFGSGLLAFAFARSDACNVQRTLTVWQDEASMMAFVVSEAHAEAIRNTAQVSRGGSITHTFETASSDDLEWSAVAAELVNHDGPIY